MTEQTTCQLRYLRFSPDPSLGEWVTCGILVTGEEGSAYFRALPDNIGCFIWPDVIDHFATVRTGLSGLGAFEQGIRRASETGGIDQTVLDALIPDKGLGLELSDPQTFFTVSPDAAIEIAVKRVVRTPAYDSPGSDRFQKAQTLARESKDDYPRSTNSGPIVTNP